MISTATDLLELARRKLREEVGGEAESWETMGTCYLGLGLMPQAVHLYLARGVHLHEQETEVGEIIEVQPVPFAQALAMARSGEIESSPYACALLRAEVRLQGLMRLALIPWNHLHLGGKGMRGGGNLRVAGGTSVPTG